MYNKKAMLKVTFRAATQEMFESSTDDPCVACLHHFRDGRFYFIFRRFSLSVDLFYSGLYSKLWILTK